MKDFNRNKSIFVFISYNKADKLIAREIALFLAAENINVWYDEWEISAGDSIIEQIAEGLHGCTHFIILWSKNASTSNWVRKELQSILSKAIQSGSPIILPIKLEEIPLPELISDIHYIKYLGVLEEDRKEILIAITGQKPSYSFLKAIVKKYHKVIHGPKIKYLYGLVACPKCGYNILEKIVYYNDQLGPCLILYCNECGWEDKKDYCAKCGGRIDLNIIDIDYETQQILLRLKCEDCDWSYDEKGKFSVS